MYNPQLKTFLQVADAGSFSKAAAQQYITAPALIKQINLLEKHLGVSLFDRTHRGLEMTEAGKIFYQEATQLIRQCDAVVTRIKQVASKDPHIVRVGVSPLTPANILVDLLPRIHQICPDLQLQMVPFVNNIQNAIDILSHLGQDIDVVMGIFDSGLLSMQSCRCIELFREPFRCAVSAHHRLAQKSSLSIQDLYGEDLMLVHSVWGEQVIKLREDLAQHPQINVVTFDVFEMDIFNRCVNNGSVLISVASWENVHPQVKILPVDWSYSTPFGLLLSPEPSPAVGRFIDAIQTALN